MAGERILIIDGNPECVEFLLTNVLSPLGYLAQIARTGQEGLNAARQERPDLVLLDLDLNSTPGVQVLEQLHTFGDPPVILLARPGAETEALHAMRIGACDALIRPLRTEETTQAITRALQRERLVRERDWLVRKLAASNEALERSLAEIQALYHVCKTIPSSLDLQDTLTAVVQAAVWVTQAEEGYLLLRDLTSDELYLRASQELHEERATSLCVRVDDNVARQVLHTGEPVALSSEGSASIKIRCKHPFNDTGHLVRSLISVPLYCEQQVIGVLVVDNLISEKSLASSDLMILSALADYASISINNAQAYTRINNALSCTQAELSALQYKTDQILQNTSEGIYSVDKDLRITEVNPGLEQISGWQESELIGRRYDEVFVPQVNGHRIAPEQTTPGKALCTQSAAVSIQSTIRAKDSRRICVADTAVPLRAEDGTLDHVLGIIRDATPEVELSQLRRDWLQSIQLQDFRIDQLTEETLNILHLEADPAVTQCHPVTLKPIVNQIIRKYEKVASGSSVQATLTPDLPFVVGNESKIELALVNLINNALLLGDAEQSVRISAQVNDESVIVTVEGSVATDRSDEYASIIQTIDYSENKGSFGEHFISWWATPQIRFYIASKLIEAQGGQVWTENHSGTCARFHFSLPKIEVQDVAKALID